MHKIRPWLYTGNIHATEDQELLKQHTITAMLQLHRPVEQPGIVSLYLPIDDGYAIPQHLLVKGIAFIKEQHAAGKIILVACGAGISRSSAFATAGLATIEDLPLRDAFWAVREANPKAMPDEVQWQALAAHFDDDTDFWDLWWDAEM